MSAPGFSPLGHNWNKSDNGSTAIQHHSRTQHGVVAAESQSIVYIPAARWSSNVATMAHVATTRNPPHATTARSSYLPTILAAAAGRLLIIDYSSPTADHLLVAYCSSHPFRACETVRSVRSTGYL